MTGQPKLQQLEADIARDGGADHMFDQIRDGVRVADIMKRYGLSKSMFYRWLDNGPEERRAAFKSARTESAGAYVDKAEDALTDKKLKVAPTSAEVSLANSKSKFYLWLAGKMDRATYGDDPLVALTANLNVGELHLNALIGGGLAALEDGEPDLIQEAEVIAIESGEPTVEEEFEPDLSLVGVTR